MSKFRNTFFNHLDATEACNLLLRISGTAAEDIPGSSSTPEEVSWVFKAAIRKGEVENLKKLVREISEASKKAEPNTRSYHWYISEDGLHGEVHEHYRNSAAALEHLSTFNTKYADRIMTMIEPESMTVFGYPSSALKREIAGANPVFMQTVTGFSRK